MAFTEWGLDPPRESLRLISLARDALTKLGETNPAAHVIVVRENSSASRLGSAKDTVLISRMPFTPSDLVNTRQWLRDSQLQEVFLPDSAAQTPFAELLRAPNPAAFYKSYAFDVAPVDDDRPYFNAGARTRNDTRHFAAVAVTVLTALVILWLPRLALGVRLPKQKGLGLFLMYFVCLGVGYMLIQVALIQHFILLLGQPTHAITVIVFFMLVSSGVGSLFSKRAIVNDDVRLMAALACAAATVASLAFSAPQLVQLAGSFALPMKVMFTAACITPATFFMGMVLPAGLSRLESTHAPAVRWAWAANSACSVLGSTLAIALAVSFGFRATLLMGGALHMIALLVVLAAGSAT